MKLRFPTQKITAEFAAADANRDTRVVPMTVYTGATVLRFSWENGLHELTLSMDPKHVRLSQLNSGRAPFTKGHASADDPEATIGVIEGARIEGGKVKADVRFSKRPDVEPLYSDVLDGILANVSVGARLLKVKETTAAGAELKSFLATDWEPFAVALVGLGADPGAHFGAAAEIEQTECEVEFSRATAQGGLMETNETNNTTVADLAVKQRIAATLQLGGEFLLTHSEKPLAEFRTLAIDEQARLSNAAGGGIRHVHAEIVRDGREGLVSRMAEALACRYTGKAPSDGAREYMNASISDMARVLCSANGLSVSGFGAERFIKLGLTSTSDFPALTTEAGNRMLLAAYQAATPAIMRVSRRSSAPDFRKKSAIRLSGAPKLIKVPESGEITHGGRAESKESYRLYTFARIFGITREALVNDDLSAFSDFSRSYGVAAANLQAQELVDLLYGAGGVGPEMDDTKALIHTDHANLNGSPAAISDTTFSAGRLALRLSKDADGETIIECSPRYLLVPAALETVAEKYLATLYPAEAANANPFSGKYELIVEPRLDAKSITAWWMFADPALAPVLEHSFLNDAGGPTVDSKLGFEVLGQEFRCVLDYGVGCIGWRGIWKGNA